MTLLIITFIAGVLTVLAPCILPLLPVILGGTLSGSDAGEEIRKRRAITVTISLGLSVIAFTLLLKASSVFIGVPESAWKWISGGIILVLGVITVFPSLWEKLSFTNVLNRESNKLLGVGYEKKNFWGDVIIGAALGPVFSTCSPTYFVVLATVLPEKPVLGIIYLLAYTLGLCLMLLLVALLGQRIMIRLGVAADPRGWFKRILGVIFILVGIAIVTGYDKILEAKILSMNFFDITKVEQKLLELKR
ncbi:MAG: cytochrome c biogenesis protein CcdA [Candidatus Taylorbacteria bacterium]